MYRVLVGSSPTLTQTFYDDETPVDVGTVTVQDTAADGTVVVPAETATTHGDDDVYSYSLPAAAAGDLAVLTVTWSGDDGRTATTTVEVVGGRLFELADLREEPDLESAD